MDIFKTIPTINEIKSRKSNKDLMKDINIIKKFYNDEILSVTTNVSYTSLCNIYKCLTLAISHYIIKCSSPLPVKIYEIKHNMEQKILSERFLNNNELTYEWLIDTFQYTGNIPANTQNSVYTQINSKQVCVDYNENYVIFNKLALLVKDNTLPFTINFNSDLTDYYYYVIFITNEKFNYVLAQLMFIQILKSKADSNIKYTLFEEAINERLEKLSILKEPLTFKKAIKSFREVIQAAETLDLKYKKYLTKEV